MDASLLKRLGLDFWKIADFETRPIKLRDGRDAEIYFHLPTGHGILHPRFWESQEYYQDQYRKEFTADLDAASGAEKHLATYQELNRRQFNQIASDLKSDSRYLEVGCSFGGVISQVAARGVKRVVGVEPNRSDAAFVRARFPQVSIENGSFFDVSFPENSFDVIASFEVLEHVESPVTFLKKCFQLLGPGGVLNIEVPNHHEALLHIYQKPGYSGFYYHKAHIHYFTPQSLSHVAAQAGFVTGEVLGFQMYPFFNQMHWLLNDVPQRSANSALEWGHFDRSGTSAGKKMDELLTQFSTLYQKEVEKELVSDCLVFRSKKA